MANFKKQARTKNELAAYLGTAWPWRMLEVSIWIYASILRKKKHENRHILLRPDEVGERRVRCTQAAVGRNEPENAELESNRLTLVCCEKKQWMLNTSQPAQKLST